MLMENIDPEAAWHNSVEELQFLIITHRIFSFSSERLQKDFSRKICKVQMCAFPICCLSFCAVLKPPSCFNLDKYFPFHHLKSPAFSVIRNWPAWVAMSVHSYLEEWDGVVNSVHTNSNWFDPSENEWKRQELCWLPSVSVQSPIHKWKIKSLQFRMEHSHIDPS